MARKKVAKKSTARKKKKASDSDEEATADFVRNNKARRSRLDDVSFDDDGRTRAIAAKPRKSEDSQDFELVGVQTAEERAEANRQRAEQEGDVLEVDDDASDAPPPLGYVCVLKSDGADGERVPLHETLKFGRALDNDVRVPVARCSRLHAELTTVDGRATLQNHARAANTTVLRGETLKPKEVRDVSSGDVFEICGRRFRFEATVAPAPAPAPSPHQAVDVDLTGAPDSDDDEEPEFSPPDSAPQESESDYEEESDESEEEEESDDDSRADDYCFRCGQRGHWAQDCGQPYSYYGYGRY